IAGFETCSRKMLDFATKPAERLRKIASLFETLHEYEVEYCHWKSNEHLAASMRGDTDLDVLFREDERDRLELILKELGFKKFTAVKEKQYRDIIDFLALDPGSGKIIHLHTHYRLTMGEPCLKGFQFNYPIEERILSSRIYNEEFGIYCIQPAFELVLLYIREALRLRHRDTLRSAFGNRPHPNPFVMREYQWLKIRSSQEEIRNAITTVFAEQAEILPFVTAEFNTRAFARLASAIKNGHGITRLYSPLTGLVLRWRREMTLALSRYCAMILDRPMPFKRVNPRGGVVVAVVGADGSGKSTVTENLMTTFGEKLDVYKIYFGRGDGKASWMRTILQSLRGKRNRKNKNREFAASASAARRGGGLRLVYKCVQALLVAHEKRQNLRRMHLARKKGALVICDRYPQNQIMGYNDGPLLHAFHNAQSSILRAIARYEARIYAAAENSPPDIIIKLVADADVVERRKPGETAIEELRAKIDGIRKLRFKSPGRTVTVDAAKPLEDVLYTVKKEIWNTL
ncbi:MAG TPA: hypothetical protein VF490_13985, partial [Chryseosolibacter sp.]